MVELLEQVGSPKLKQGQVAVYDSASSETRNSCANLRCGEYIPEYSQRLGTANQNLLPRAVSGVVFCDAATQGAELEKTLGSLMESLEEVALIVENEPIDPAGMSACLEKYKGLKIISLRLCRINANR